MYSSINCVCVCVLDVAVAHVSTLQLLNNNMGEGMGSSAGSGHVTTKQACDWLPRGCKSCNWLSGNGGPKMTITKRRDIQ